MSMNPPPLSLLHSRRAALIQSRSALPDAPVVPDRSRPHRTARATRATRSVTARALHHVADVLAPRPERAALR
ncbi:hypothetical protein KIN34_11780 [Cellulomonas sp. DKR-3]|uniref:Uncharacterized protein n=1 Tax=Cellulomonas fulva TaxID=2835530 RepID=A0ABS5U0N0_9CELL|nr:hypothetical protein [Cellulomonas fulva]MBT0994963.1 hypothetical protein [Cellulomonas fulva]